MDAYLEPEGRNAQLIGIGGEHKRHRGLGLADLLVVPRGGPMGSSPSSRDRSNMSTSSLTRAGCCRAVQSGLYLLGDAGTKLAALVSGPGEHTPFPKVRVEVIARQREEAEVFLGELRRLTRERNVYRGRVVSLSMDHYGRFDMQFHQIPSIDSDQIILPPDVLRRTERHTLTFSAHRERLRSAGQHLKRGLLLYGPPGTGKTLTAMYLAGQMKDRTVLMLTGRGYGLIPRTCALARILQPSTVIFEDVDLVAEERTRPNAAGTLLFELLNEMDGLGEDVDVLFLLTTNRPDLLEPALAARPGRIDQAIEIPPPDADCRRRLLDLYSRDLRLSTESWDLVIERTSGVSAAFIRELIRKAALFAADESPSDDDIMIEDRHLDEALHEMISIGGDLTRSLLGATTADGRPVDSTANP
ncbi:MAG: AAA family ATPase [Thermomicrobiales bacterium]